MAKSHLTLRQLARPSRRPWSTGVASEDEKFSETHATHESRVTFNDDVMTSHRTFLRGRSSPYTICFRITISHYASELCEATVLPISATYRYARFRSSSASFRMRSCDRLSRSRNCASSMLMLAKNASHCSTYRRLSTPRSWNRAKNTSHRS